MIIILLIVVAKKAIRPIKNMEEKIKNSSSSPVACDISCLSKGKGRLKR